MPTLRILLKLGASGEEVLELNKILSEKGYLNNKEPDDKFDAHTNESVLNFQKQFGLRQDAIVGNITWGVLNQVKNYVDGIDVSYWQGNIDWAKVSSTHVKFAFARVSDGVRYIDPTFAPNWAKIKEHGLIRGVYQYFRPAQDIPRQVDILLEKINKLEAGDLPPVLDVEDPHYHLGDYKNKIDLWVDLIKDALNCDPIIYTGAYYWNSHIGYAPDYTTCPLWVANYQRAAPIIPNTWNQWAFWQYGYRKISGISGDVDANYFKGSIDDLKDLANLQHPS